MKVVQIQFNPWDRVYDFDLGDFSLLVGDSVIVKTEMGTEIGKVINFKNLSEEETEARPEIKPVLRKATSIDIEKIPDEKQKKRDLEFCKKSAVKHELPMKLVDIHYSFDGARITFAFIADGRIDFRELVKDLTRHFNRTIRLQQIGIRDEAKLMGDFGHCGRPLCCGQFLGDLESITSEMAESQQCVHRGSERISGICGRLMCCLAFENKGYEEMSKKLPAVGEKINYQGKKCTVLSQHILKQTVSIESKEDNGDRAVIEVDMKDK